MTTSISLLDFQTEASQQISSRIIDYILSPIFIGRNNTQRRIPFIQLLDSITASGKTLVLADAVSAIAQQINPKPVVLWLSKATVVVSQTYANLDNGGTYHNLLDSFEVHTLADYDEDDLRTNSSSLLFFATVGTFNQKQKADSSLNVFKSAIDEAAKSTWESLKLRPDPAGLRRTLIVVYDEAHNISEQQTELLLELEPDAFILATATSRLPAKFNSEVTSQLKSFGKFADADLITIIDPSRVGASGLIKKGLNLVGSQAPMESVLADLRKAFNHASKDAISEGLLGKPKAIYVCKTNVSQSTGMFDSPRQHFNQRQAPPILIWRWLVEELKIDPSEVAVYCDLKEDKDFPLPIEFVIFKGGDKDYDQFIRGNFRHIIFNQSLQEGWDDPYVYFAYIDKSMGSKIQVEQIIGRLLRQPGRKHYRAERLNTAQIHIRVDSPGVFDQVVAEVDEKICMGNSEIKIMIAKPGAKVAEEIDPKAVFTVPVTSVVTDGALEPITERIDQITDFTNDNGTNTRGKGHRTQVQRVIGVPGAEVLRWESYGDSATVLARWLFQREVELTHKDALGLVVTSNTDGSPSKFDARIGFGSNAAHHMVAVAHDIGQIYTDEVYLKLRRSNPYVVGPILVDPSNAVTFTHAVHSRYGGLNPLELQFAKAIDEFGMPWCRNMSGSGYKIPLIEPGRTKNFYPDFLVWSDGNVFAIDTKGSHLHADAARKFVDIKPAEGIATRVFVRFISDGKVTAAGPQANSSGFTVWSSRPNGSAKYSHLERMVAAVEQCLKPGI